MDKEIDLAKKFNFRFHKKSCHRCKYYKVVKWHKDGYNDGLESKCSLLKRTLSVIGTLDYLLIKLYDMQRVCDGFE